MEKRSNKKVSLVAGAAALTLLLLLTIACGSPGDTSEPPAFPSVTTAPATPMSASQREPTTEEILKLERAFNTTDVKITMGYSPDPALAGEELVYTLKIVNGVNPANKIRVIDTLPSGVSHVRDDSECVEDQSGKLVCDLGVLLNYESAEIKITVLIDADLVLNAGGPTTIINEASVENLAGPDPDPSNNDATEHALVNDKTRLRQ